MSEIRTKEFIKTILADKPARKELKKLGLTEKELELIKKIVTEQKEVISK